MFSLSLLFIACAPDLSKDRPVAETKPVEPAHAEQPAPVEQPAAALAAPALTAPKVLTVDAASSKLGALGAKITATHPVDFHTFVGQVGLDGENVTGVSFAAEIASLESDHPKLTTHLKGEDFLWAEKYPHATFLSTAITPGGSDGHTHTISGNLTIRGKTASVTFPATIAVTPAEVTAKTEFVINRKDFDVVYPGKPDDLVQDNVVLKVDFKAPRS